MNHERWKGWLTKTAEALFALVLVLICFTVFTGILSFSFPQGTRLTELMQAREYDRRLDLTSRLEFGLEDDPRTTFTAFLADVFHDVKEKESGSIAWGKARSGIRLKDRHAVQSFAKSGARIAFDEQNDIRLGENSLVVVRALERDLLSQRRSAALVVLEGELQARLEGGSGENAMQVEIATAKSSIRFDSAKAKQADFRVKVHPDQSSTYSVFSGVVELLAGGQTTLVKPNFSITVDAEGVTGLPVALPGMPALSFPDHEQAYFYRSAPPRVRFEWEAREDADQYRLVIARDSEFEDVVEERELADTRFFHGNLKQGHYYWRVHGVSNDISGRHDETREISVVHDFEPPALQVQFPDDPVVTAQVLLTGKAEPGAQLFIGNETVSTMDSGTFEYAMQVRPGVNVLVVEAIDAAGNTAYRSQLIHGKFQ